MAKRSIISLIILCILVYNVKSAHAFYQETTFFQQNENNYFLHTIERGQTVYSIANTYGVTVEAIYKLNPSSEAGIREGDKLRIPQESGSYLYHTIQPKETLYSLSRKYYMKIEDITNANPGLTVETLHIGKIIRIPTNLVTTPESGSLSIDQQVSNALLSQQTPVKKVNTIRVALFLPFGLDEGVNIQTASGQRFIEYYEGFLIAMHRAKQQGISIDLKVVNIDSSGIDALKKALNNNDLKKMNLLIGGVRADQIAYLSAFSKEHNIPYVIPVTSTSSEVLNNANIYQINTPNSYLTSKATLGFSQKYKNDNIIIVKNMNDTPKKTEFVDELAKELTSAGIPYQTVSFSNKFQSELHLLLLNEKNNVFVMDDDTAPSLSRLLTPLKVFAETSPEYTISLFGHPSWQAFGSEFTDDLFRFNASFYTFYYANPTSQQVKDFYGEFYRWYSRELLKIIPKYGILGYDTGMFFLQLIHKYGANFDSYVNQLAYTGVQTDFRFERVNNWGGFINTNLYMVTYNPNLTISKSIIQ